MYGQFFILFGLILVGYYCNKKGYLPLETNKNVGHMVMRVTIPAMLITTIASIEITDRVLRAFLLSAAGQIAMMVVFGFLMRQYGRKRGLDSRLLPMLDLTAGSLNTGFIGLPVTMIFFGQAGIIYMSAGVLALNLYLWSYGVYLISDKKATGAAAIGKSFLQGAINPNCISILLGLLLAVTHTARFVPTVVLGFLTKVGDLSTPLSLIYIGAGNQCGEDDWDACIGNSCNAFYSCGWSCKVGVPAFRLHAISGGRADDGRQIRLWG